MILLVSALALALVAVALVLLALRHEVGALVTIGVAIIILQLVSFASHKVGVGQGRSQLRRLDANLAAVEKLVSRAEWRAAESHRETVALLRRRHTGPTSDAVSDGHGGMRQPTRAALRSGARGGATDGEDIERFLIHLLTHDLGDDSRASR